MNIRFSYEELEALLPLLHPATAELAFEDGAEDPRMDLAAAMRQRVSDALNRADEAKRLKPAAPAAAARSRDWRLLAYVRSPDGSEPSGAIPVRPEGW